MQMLSDEHLQAVGEIGKIKAALKGDTQGKESAITQYELINESHDKQLQWCVPLDCHLESRVQRIQDIVQRIRNPGESSKSNRKNTTSTSKSAKTVSQSIVLCA